MAWQYKELARELMGREIKSRYKQSFLGYAWVILNPFFQMLVMTFVFSLIIRIPSLGVPYAIFLYVALLPWNLFANSLSHATNSLVANAPLLKKIYFPRELFVISTIMAKLVDFGLASLILVAFMLYFRVAITWNILWVIPLLLIQLAFTYGLALILAAVNLLYRDVQYLLSLLILLWMYLTPVLYPMEMVPDRYRFIFRLNPMSVLVNAYREVILVGGHPKYSSLIIAGLVGLFSVLIGRYIFKKLERIFADVV
ncbi:MAG: ABC transporter permease [bacterium]